MRNKVLILYIVFCIVSIGRAETTYMVSEICQDTSVTNSLISEVEKHAYVRRFLPKEKEKKEERKRRKKRKHKDAFDFDGFGNNGLVSILLYLLVFALLGFIIFTLVTNFRKEEVIEQRVIDLDNLEDIADLNVNYELDKALKEGDLKLAFRIRYLGVLQSLSEEQAIRWKLRKTNSVYVQEMRPHQFYGVFRMLTKNYDYIWYGNREITREKYESLSPYFDQFTNKQSPTDGE